MPDADDEPLDRSAPAGREGLVRFGTFVLDLRTGELSKSGLPLKLQHRPSRVLALLVSRPGELLTREEIQREVWPNGTFVDFELGLNTCIRQIRQVLGDDAETPRFVETMRGRGYRFIAPVERVSAKYTLPPGKAPIRTRFALAAVAVVLALASLFARSAHLPLLQPRATATYDRLTFRRGTVTSARFGPGSLVVYSAVWEGGQPELLESDGINQGERALEVGGDRVVSVSSRGELAYLKGMRLAQVPLLGGVPKEILGNVWAADSTRDGSEFAVARAVGLHTWLEFPLGTLLCEVASPSHLRISPDGTGVALLEHPVCDDDQGLVTYVDRQGHKRVLSRGWASIEGIAWRADGGEVWFTAARLGADSGLHAVDLSGHERDIASGMGRLVLQDVARDGKVLLVRGDIRAEIRYASHGDRGEQDLSWLDYSTLRDLSPDGRMVLFEESGQAGGAEHGVFVRRTDGSPAVRVGQGLSRALSPDGRWVLAAPAQQPDHLEVLPVGEGERRVLRDAAIKNYNAAQWLPGSQAIVFTGIDGDGAPRVYSQGVFPDATSPRAITQKGTYGYAHMLSPDGKHLLATCGDEYCLYAVESQLTPLHLRGVDQSYRPLCWGDHGRAVYFSEATYPFRQLYRFDLAAQRLSPSRVIAPADAAGIEGLLRYLTTPDEGAYAYGYRRTTSQLYLVTNLS